MYFKNCDTGKELTSYPAQNKKRQNHQIAISSRQMEAQAKNKELQKGTQSIFDLEGRNKNMVLNTTTLLNRLLKQNFTSKQGEILQLQLSDLWIREIFDLLD